MSRRKGETIKQYDLRRARETAAEQEEKRQPQVREDKKFKRAMMRAGYEPVKDDAE